MYLAAVIFAGILAFTLLANLKGKENWKTADKKEHPLKLFYPFAESLYSLLKRKIGPDFFGSRELMKEVYPDRKPEEAGKTEAVRCIASAVAVILGTCFLVFIYGYTETSQLKDGKYLKRRPAGEGTASYSMLYEREEEAGEKERKVSVSEVRLTGEDFLTLRQKSLDYLEKAVINGNETADSIKRSLYLPDSIPGTTVTVKWKNDISWIISGDGSLKNEELEAPVKVLLCAELNYYEESWSFEKMLTVMPKEYSPEEIFDRQLGKLLAESDEKNGNGEYYELPADVAGERITWSEQKDNTKEIIVCLGLIAAFCMPVMLKKELKNKQELRKNQMLSDYPDIVSKMALLFTAGMTCRAAWTKICTEYLKEKEAQAYGKNGFRYAYEEMLRSLKELNLGEPEIRVYEKFGIRCNITEYRRLATLLTRNLRRGNAEIVELLENEATEAFEERKSFVRRKGEEAGTKLLIPMFGMLIIVFAIVIVPAFSSM